jgi:hypothetical protein
MPLIVVYDITDVNVHRLEIVQVLHPFSFLRAIHPMRVVDVHKIDKRRDKVVVNQ